MADSLLSLLHKQSRCLLLFLLFKLWSRDALSLELRLRRSQRFRYLDIATYRNTRAHLAGQDTTVSGVTSKRQLPATPSPGQAWAYEFTKACERDWLVIAISHVSLRVRPPPYDAMLPFRRNRNFTIFLSRTAYSRRQCTVIVIAFQLCWLGLAFLDSTCQRVSLP